VPNFKSPASSPNIPSSMGALILARSLRRAPSIRFLFARPSLYLQPPLDSASRRTNVFDRAHSRIYPLIVFVASSHVAAVPWKYE